MARTKRYSAKEVADALRAAGGVVVQAARQLGCSPRTVYRYGEEFTTVKKAMTEGRKDTYAEAQGYLIAMMRDREHRHHQWAVEQVLKHFGEQINDGLDFTDRKRLDHRGEVDIRGFNFDLDGDDAT